MPTGPTDDFSSSGSQAAIVCPQGHELRSDEVRIVDGNLVCPLCRANLPWVSFRPYVESVQHLSRGNSLLVSDTTRHASRMDRRSVGCLSDRSGLSVNRPANAGCSSGSTHLDGPPSLCFYLLAVAVENPESKVGAS